MMKVIRCALAALIIVPSTGAAQDFDVGLAAFRALDFSTALGEWVPLAEAGNAEAQERLGWMYANGWGVARDHAKAVRLYRPAAKQGNANAQSNLGWMYWQGHGVPQDYATAHMWFNIAAANGNIIADSLRDNISREMTPADVSEAQRRARICMTSGYEDCD